jgi:hypothetical protein
MEARSIADILLAIIIPLSVLSIILGEKANKMPDTLLA